MTAIHRTRRRAPAGRSVAALAACALVPAAAGAEPDLKTRIDRVAAPLVERGVAVGLLVGILTDGETTFIGYGETERGSGVAPGPDTLYEIGSITKVFTAVLLADAVERGEVRLEDPVRRHLPEAVRLRDVGEPITLAHLAEHTSGLPRLPGNFAPSDPADPYADYGPEKIYAALTQAAPPRAPGEYEYSNFGAGLLGHLLERALKGEYETLLRERVLVPLGLEDTGIRLGSGQRGRLAPPYGAGLEPARNWHLAALAGAGALRSSGRDLLAFARANLETHEGSLGRALERTRRERREIGGGLSIGLGWHIAADHETRWHDGGTGGYHSWIAVIPDLRLATVVLANTATERITALGELVTRAAAGMDVEPMSMRTEIEVAPGELQRYVGAYELAPGFVLEVSVEEGRLMVQATGQDRYPVFASGPGEFFYEVVDAQLSFVTGADGRVERVVLHQGGRDVEGHRTR